MTYRGKVKSGVIVLEEGVQLPEGADVQVQPVEDVSGSTAPTWAEVFKNVIGKAQGLPADASRNHDHYLYNTPKK